MNRKGEGKGKRRWIKKDEEEEERKMQKRR